ncbi:Delta24-sterol reductase [Burkholderiales bacterium]|nr:Delta24-sterol reductase [Burkholderiales bacterium]
MDYARKKARLAASLAAAGADGAPAFGLAKRTSNLFRDRSAAPRPRIDLSGFDEVVRVDPEAGVVEAEGMTTFEALADATLARGTMPAVVPQLKSITLGGAVAGVGIEATSFRHGLVHDAVVALDVLTGDGRIVRCTADNEHADLFRGFANSYGTLGYALGVTMRTLPVRRYVEATHVRHTDAARAFDDLAMRCDDPGVDFLDGVVFAPGEILLTEGRFVDAAPWASDYTYERIYYRSLRERERDYLATRDWLWRWDTDWFWCSKNVGAQWPPLRRLLGRRRLNSVTYQRIMRWNSRVGLSRAYARLRGRHVEPVIQDVDIPVERAAEFLDFLHREVGILPVWLCPIRAPAGAARATLYPLEPGRLYVNVGFWDVVESREARPPGEVNRAIERIVEALGGLKSLYSDSYYTEDAFWRIFDRDAYLALRKRYDPDSRLRDLYDKCVRRRAA